MSDDESFTFTPNPPGVDLALWAALMTAMSEAASEKGYELYFKQETGVGRVWIRKAEEKRA